MEPESPSKSKIQLSGYTHNLRSQKFVVVTIFVVLILVGVYGYLISKNSFTVPDGMHTYFTVVLDCGSTGSRVNVFEWFIGNGSNVNGYLPILLRSYPNNLNRRNGCRYHCMQTEPGLHNFVGNATAVTVSLAPLIRYAEQWVPLERRGATPIFVLATAGMRRLATEDGDWVLRNVEGVVKKHGFLYKRNWIRVLSGKEEAYYGWVALNYKMRVFGSSFRLNTLGLLDLGGSSLQVVAEVDGSKKDEHVFRSKIGPIEHDIVAYSLPAFGLNEAFDGTIVMLSHSQEIKERDGGMFEVRHPCLGSGFGQNYTCRGCFGLDSLDMKKPDNRVQEVFLIGEPNWERCKVIARAAAINSSSLDLLEHRHSKCIGLFSHGGNTTLNLTNTLHSVSRYHALSGFFAVYNALNLSQRVNLTMLWESGEKLCSGARHDQKSFNGQDCFRVPYLASLIENALCLSGIEIVFGPGDVSWTLGASLIEGEFLWHRPEASRNSILVLTENLKMPSPLLTFILLSFLLLLVYSCQIKFPMAGRIPAARSSLSSYKPQAN